MPNDSDDVRAQAESSSLDLLNTVSVNVPAFWPKSAEAWFIQVEAQFALKGVMARYDLPYCFTHFDDILVFSSNLEQHVDHLRQVLLLCRQYGLTIGLPKCEFVVPEIEFLGHLVSATGCSPLVKHTTAVSEFPVPADKPALQRFLGMLNFYRKFLRGAAGVLAPLTDALKGD